MLGTLLGGRYKIMTVLGAGGFGQTFLAEDTQHSNRQCVVKQFKPASQDARFLEVARRLFQTEVETLRRLGQHDQIPELYDSFEEEQEFYLVQEFIDGTSISDELAHGTRMSEVEVIDLLTDVLTILEFVHNNRVIHRDIKPANLIRRKQDGKIVLIDFGAVKEIQTQLTGGTGQTSFTVGIGTQGYTPTEQLAGKPRYCSDIYALGITAIQALTGMQPSQLVEDPDTSELIWQEHAVLSLGLAFILDRMVRYHYSQRYQSAREVLQALQRMAELPTDLTEIPPSMLLPESLLQDQTVLSPPLDWRSKLKAGLQKVAIATLAATSLVLGMREIGWMEPLELAAYDQMMRLRPEAPPDPRLLIVAITEDDLQTLQRPTPSDQDVARVITTLQQYQPRTIGLDLYRDLPQQPGQAQLLKQLQAPNIIAIMNLGNPQDSSKVPPPPNVPPERIGFNDFPIDPDGVVRRNLMFATVEPVVYHSFSLRLALAYLAEQNISPINSSSNPDYIEINGTVFPPLEPNDGGYNQEDTNGYQILLDYRSGQEVARQVTFTDVLNGTIQPEWIRDKIVLIGTTAPSGKDLFATPYSAGRETDFQMPGVVVHAQMVSQLLTTVLDGKPLIWFFPDWAEVLWIIGWGAAGGTLAWCVRHPVALGFNSVVMIAILGGTGFILFLNQAWIPVITPAIAFLVTDAAVTAYRSYRSQQEQRELTQLFWNDRRSGPLGHQRQNQDVKGNPPTRKM
jgi:CHASE2 domain-containing sensor protein/tRNA A-37 threonylcarbamoyl transferase component Bud32